MTVSRKLIDQESGLISRELDLLGISAILRSAPCTLTELLIELTTLCWAIRRHGTPRMLLDVSKFTALGLERKNPVTRRYRRIL